MNMHKHIMLTPLDRREIWKLHQTGLFKQKALTSKFRVYRQTISKILRESRKGKIYPKNSTNS